MHGHPFKFTLTPSSLRLSFHGEAHPSSIVGTADRQAHRQGAREHGAGDCVVQASFVFFPLKSFVFPNRIRQSWSGLYNGGLWYVSTGWAAVRVQSGVALGTLPGQLFPAPHQLILSVAEGRKGAIGLGSGPNRKRGRRGTRWRCRVWLPNVTISPQWLPRAGAFKNPVSSQSPGRVQGHGATGSGTAGVLWWPRAVPMATSHVRVVSGSSPWRCPLVHTNLSGKITIPCLLERTRS